MNKLVYGIRLAKKVTEKNDKVKVLREEVNVMCEKLSTTDAQLNAVKVKVSKVTKVRK